MNVAAKERKRKEISPADFCADPRCLWRVRKNGRYDPCPRHHDVLTDTQRVELRERILEGLRESDGADLAEQPDITAAETEDINALVREQSILTDAELRTVLGRASDGEWDDFDFLALCEHVQAQKAEHNEYVLRAEQKANDDQVLVFHANERAHKARAQLGAARAALAYVKSRLPAGMSLTDALTAIEKALHESPETEQ